MSDAATTYDERDPNSLLGSTLATRDGRRVEKRSKPRACLACTRVTRWELFANDESIGPACSDACVAKMLAKQRENAAVNRPEPDADPINSPPHYNAGHATHATGAVRSTDADGHRYDLIDPLFLERIAATLATGAARYGEHNWLKGFKFSDVLNHLIRHVELFRQGDASEDHLAHAACNLMFLCRYEQSKPELDDRPWRTDA